VAYFRAVEGWLHDPAHHITGPINVVETGHSLGGQEADFVDVVATNDTTIRDTVEAVTFDAPGIPTHFAQPNTTYDALNISVSNELVHIGGALANAGYIGNSVTIDTGTPLAPYGLLGLVESVASGTIGPAIIGFGHALATGLGTNHKTGVLNAYLREHPALGGADLQAFSVAWLTNDAVKALAKVSAADYAKMTSQAKNDLYASLLHPPVTGAPSSSTSLNESFTESTSGTGTIFTGSKGDTLEIDSASHQAVLTDSAGNKLTAIFNADDTSLLGITDSFADAATGTASFDSVNQSGASTSKITYASGGYATTIDDGQGNITTDYYSKNGILASWAWVHADGSSGTGSAFSYGSTVIPGGGSFDVPEAGHSRIVNPDGSYQTITWDAQDNATNVSFDASGNVVVNTTTQGPGRNYDTQDLTSTTTSDGRGDTITRKVDANHILVSDTWTNTDGSSGSDTYNASGSVSGKTVETDGSSSTYTVYSNANEAHPSTFVASPAISFSVFGPYDSTRDQYDSDGALTSDQWQLADGASGSDSFSPGGSGTGTIHHADGTASSVVVDSALDITITNTDASGSVSGTDEWFSNGTYKISIDNTDGSSKTYLYETNGQVQETDTAADGGVVFQDTVPAGALLSPDGSFFGRVNNSDGSFSISYLDSNSDALIFNVSAGNSLQSMDHVGASRAPGSGFGFTLSNGQTGESPYNSETPVFTDADGTQFTEYLNSSGQLTGDDWVKPDASHGNDIHNTDGSGSGFAYDSDGTYTSYEKDSEGDLTNENFSAAGALVSDSWQDVDGSFGTDVYNADGSSSGQYSSADSSREVYANDGKGNVTQSDYSATNVLTDNRFANSDGSHGSETFNSDGTITGVLDLPDGSYANFAVDTAGTTTSDDYSAADVLVGHGLAIPDGAGNSVAYSFDLSGNLLSQTWSKADGTSWKDTIPAGSGITQDNLTVDHTDAHSITGTPGGIILASGNNDTLISGGGYSIIDAGGAGSLVEGGSGSDILVALGAHTTLIGGSGNEVFEISDPTDVIVADAGAISNAIVSSVSEVLPTGVDTLTLIGTGNLSGTGNDDATNWIKGNNGTDTLTAGSGQDTLISGTGITTFVGGAGIDEFDVNNSADEIDLPFFNGGSDTIRASVDYTLNSAVGTLVLTGSDDLTATDNYGFATLIGNDGHDTLIGGSGRDTLIAGSAADTFISGTGNNTFVINRTDDVIQLSAGAGSDTVDSSVSYALATGLDTLILTGSDDLTGDGNNDAQNFIQGNAGNDTLTAGSGSDTLIAGTGNTRLVAGSGSDLLESGTGIDTLVSGTGIATMYGNAGDTYVFDSGFGQDEIIQSYGQGTLSFGPGITAADLTVDVLMGSNGMPALEIHDGSGVITIDNGLSGVIGEIDFADGSQLSLAGFMSEAHVEATTISGPTGNLVLSTDNAATVVGGSGNDTIYATGVGDTLIAGSGTQQLFGANSGDILIGSSGSDSLHGGIEDDTFVGGTGSTVMYGGEGNDSYMLTQGGVATIVAGSKPGYEVIYLPQDMSFADFTPFEDASGNLILESNDAQTTLTINGFYSAGSNEKTWILAGDNDVPQILGQWVASQTHTAADYNSKIDQLRVNFAAQLDGELRDLGSQHYTMELWTNPNWNTYTFSGLTRQNIAVQNGTLAVDSSEHLDVESTQSTTDTTYQIATPTFATVSVPGSSHFEAIDAFPGSASFPSDFQVTPVYGPPGSANDPNDPTAAALLGYNIGTPTTTRSVQTGNGVTTVTVPAETTVTTATLGFTEYSITGDGANDVITTNGPTAGTLVTGNGNVSINYNSQGIPEGPLGAPGFASGNPSFQNCFANSLPARETTTPGMFIQAGSGNDTIVGTGGADVIAAGTGFDYIEGYLGTTYYVPMQGDSTQIIGDPAEPYGSGPFPLTTLVLPTGVTPQSLQYRLFTDPQSGAEVLQLTHGDSTVLVCFKSGPPFEASNNTDNASAGVNLFQFADGTVLTREQLIAQATMQSNDFDPTITPLNPTVGANEGIAAASLFSASDSADSHITWYEISNSGAGGGHFVLNGATLQAGNSFKVTAVQMSQLQYIAGSAGVDDQISVSAFDQAVWSDPQSFTVTPAEVIGTTYVYDSLGRVIESDTRNADGSRLVNTFGFNSDGSVIQTSLWTPADGSGTTTTVTDTNAAGQVTERDTASPDGSSDHTTFVYGAGGSVQQTTVWTPADGSGAVTTVYEYNADNQITERNVTNPDGSTDNFAYVYNTDGSYSETELTTPADNSGTTTTMQEFDNNGVLLVDNVSRPDGSTDDTTFVYGTDGTRTATEIQTAINGGTTTLVSSFDAQGRWASLNISNPDGSTDDSTFSYNSDGTSGKAETITPAGGGGSTTDVYVFDDRGRWLSWDHTAQDGSTDNSTFTYNSDGTSTRTEVLAAAGAAGTTTDAYVFDAQGRWLSEDQTLPDGTTDNTTFTYGTDGSMTKAEVVTPPGGVASTTEVSAFDGQGRWLSDDKTNADGSTDNSTFTYNADGTSVEMEIVTPAGGGNPTTQVSAFDSQGQLVSANTYTRSANGSYTDSWYATDGSQGNYSWNESTEQYNESWFSADGTSFSDQYQYATGGSPAVSGVSYTETYAASDGSHGTRQFDGASDATNLTWYSSATGNLSGTISDAGFIGLQNNDGLTNAQSDLTFFNPNVSPGFHSFLAGHGA